MLAKSKTQVKELIIMYICIMNKLILFFVVCASISSCNTLDVYEKSTPFSSLSWSSLDSQNYKFDIIDTNSSYNIYMVLRHQEKYPYKNIWLQLSVKSPIDTSVFNREFILADNNKWLGTTIDDVTDHRIVFNPQPIKLKKGAYSFTLKQIMREDPLPYIFSAGIRVQKVSK